MAPNRLLSLYVPSEDDVSDGSWFDELPRSKQMTPDAGTESSWSPVAADPNVRGRTYTPADIMGQMNWTAPVQEPQEGRLPTAAERSAANPAANTWQTWLQRALPAQVIPSNPEAMREKAGKPQAELGSDFVRQAITQAPLGLRGGYYGGSFREPPDPFLMPGGSGKYSGEGGQVLTFDGGATPSLGFAPGLWHGVTPPLGAWAGKVRDGNGKPVR